MDAETKQAFEAIMHELKEFRTEMYGRFDVVDDRLNTIDERLDTVDNRLDAMDNRFDAIDNRLDTMDDRFDAIDNRLDTMDNRFDAIDNRLDTMDNRFDAIENRLDCLEQGQEQLAQNTATILNAITVYSQVEQAHYEELSGKITRLSEKQDEFEKVQNQHSIDIMQLRAAQ